MTILNTYDDVPISAVEFDARTNGWSNLPRALLVDWLAVIERAARVIAPEYRAPALPDPIEYTKETIASDGPYGSSENFYYLSYYSFEVEGLRLSFERGRQESGEPLGMETTGLPNNISSYMAEDARGQAKARFFVWHTAEQAKDVETAFGVAATPST